MRVTGTIGVNGEMSARPTIAITIGDPNGIGPEVVLKALSGTELREECRPVIVGPKTVLEYYDSSAAVEILRDTEQPDRDALSVWQPDQGTDFKPEPGKMTAASGKIAGQALDCAIGLVLDGRADALVTAPVSKAALHAAGYDFPGQTEFLANRCNTREYLMMLLSGTFRVAVVTTHCALADVAARLSTDLILSKLRVLNRDLQTRFGIQKPRIAVTGLNPHAGEGGILGKEEIEIIAPVITAAQREGIEAAGPFPADSLFARIDRQPHDAYLAMYHDQGLIPLKMQSFGKAVNYTAGLPIIRTSPDHGTAFDIAGKGIATPDSMEEAIRFAVALTKKQS